MKNGLAKRETTQTPPWLATLRQAVSEQVTDEDLQGIVKTFVDKAKAGDERAAKFVIDYLMGGKFSPQQVTIHNHYEGEAPRVIPPAAARNGDDPVEVVRRYLEHAGVVRPRVIAADTGLAIQEVEAALESPGFARCGEGWMIAAPKRRRV